MNSKKYQHLDANPPEEQTELHKSDIRFFQMAYDLAP